MPACNFSPEGSGIGLSCGKGLGIISAKYFEPWTWTPLLEDDMGRIRYGKFITAMMGRIGFQESTSDEIRSFVALVASDVNHDLMRVALPLMPEIENDSVQDLRNYQKALWFQQMRNAVRQRANEDARRENTAIRRGLLAYRQPNIGQVAYRNGLSRKEQDILRRMVFTTPGAKNTASMDRLFESWMALGYPQAGLDLSMQEARERGTDIVRDSMGLPRYLRLTGPPCLEQDPLVRAPLTTFAGRTSTVVTPAATPSATSAAVTPTTTAIASPVIVTPFPKPFTTPGRQPQRRSL